MHKCGRSKAWVSACQLIQSNACLLPSKPTTILADVAYC